MNPKTRQIAKRNRNIFEGAWPYIKLTQKLTVLCYVLCYKLWFEFFALAVATRDESLRLKRIRTLTRLYPAHWIK